MVVEKLKQAVELLRKDLIESRNLEYPENSIGITSLLYCPLKVEMGEKYPDLQNKSLAIDDGYIFENTFEPYIEKVFNGRVIKDANIPYELDGFKITGHPDFVIEENDRVIILEFKAPIFFFSKNGLEIPSDEFIIDTNKKIKVSENYIEQVKIQKFITEKHYNKPVEGYLFIKTILQNRDKRMKKVLILRPVEETIDEDYMKKLIENFKTIKEPRYHWECSYCAFIDKCVKGQILLKQNNLKRR